MSALILAGTLAAGGCGDGGARHASATPANAHKQTTAVTIDAPAGRLRTSARSVVVAGVAPSPPRGGETGLRVTANGRPVDVADPQGRYRVEVALEVGVNWIAARAEVYGAKSDRPQSTSTAGPIEATRMPGPDTGTLDLATAYLVTDRSYEKYLICLEDEECWSSLRCLSVTPTRVDCPVGGATTMDPISRCELVMSVRLVGRRIHYSSYNCHGRLTVNPRRHVRRRVMSNRRDRRFRVDERREDWAREEVNERNPYGVPRFDVDRDLFLP